MKSQKYPSVLHSRIQFCFFQSLNWKTNLHIKLHVMYFDGLHQTILAEYVALSSEVYVNTRKKTVVYWEGEKSSKSLLAF